MHSHTTVFSPILQAWAAQHPRPMPWKGIRNPYFIWLSEIILQQTRVEQGLPYYERFVLAYPTIQDLAEAPLEEIYKNWEGLGYYSRARNLHEAAKMVVTQFGGVFPKNYADIRQLKGVGDYTAAAIASFAYDLPFAVLDGNVYRVLSRWMGIETPIDSTAGKQQFSHLAQELLDKERPAAHNQAIMDFGATWCTPKQPLCATCPFKTICRAHLDQNTAAFPVKSKKNVKKARFFVYFVFQKDGYTFLRQRTNKDIWQHLWEFPCIEPQKLPADIPEAQRMLHEYAPELGDAAAVLHLSKPYHQTLTHRNVAAVFVTLTDPSPTWADPWRPVNWEEDMPHLAVPRLIEWYWKARKETDLRLF